MSSAQLEPVGDVVDAELVELPERPAPEIATASAPVALPWHAEQPLRRPVVAPWLLERDQRAQAARFAAGHARHVSAYHAVRVPLYGARACLMAPRGFARLAGKGAGWAFDAEHRALRLAAVQRGDVGAARTLRADQRKRMQIAAGVAVPALVLLVVAWLVAPVWARWAAGVLLVLALGKLGATPDKPLVAPAVVPNGKRKLSYGIVTTAFMDAKLCTSDRPISFATPIHRDANGYRVVVDLPGGRTADKAIAARDEIASGLDVDERQVFLSRVRGAAGSARRVDLWVCDVDPLSIPAGTTALLDAERVNFWRPWPFGKDERGNVVELCILWAAMLVGAIPRRGKTFVARLVALAAALDPHVDLYVFDFKGSPDWTPFRQVAHRIFHGDRPDPDTGIHPVGALLDTVNELLAEVDRRNRLMRTLPADVCPEGKLTEELSRAPGYDLHLKVLVIDEVQRAFTNRDYGDELELALTDLVKAGPSAGIITVAATQKPDAKSTPTGFRDQFGIRFALYVTTRDASEAVLGAGAGGEGLHAHKLPPNAPGAGILRGTGDAAIAGGIVRTGLANQVHAEAICARGRRLRQDAGTLDGMAAGIELSATPATYSVGADLVLVLAEDKAHSDVLCARLAERWSDRYAGWRPAQLHAALKPYGVRTRQVWAESLDGEMRNRYGIIRDELVKALDAPIGDTK